MRWQPKLWCKKFRYEDIMLSYKIPNTFQTDKKQLPQHRPLLLGSRERKRRDHIRRNNANLENISISENYTDNLNGVKVFSFSNRRKTSGYNYEEAGKKLWILFCIELSKTQRAKHTVRIVSQTTESDKKQRRQNNVKAVLFLYGTQNWATEHKYRKKIKIKFGGKRHYARVSTLRQTEQISHGETKSAREGSEPIQIEQPIRQKQKAKNYIKTKVDYNGKRTKFVNDTVTPETMMPETSAQMFIWLLISQRNTLTSVKTTRTSKVKKQ